MKIEVRKKCVRMTALFMSCLLAVIPVCGAGYEVDKESPYTGDVIVAANVRMEIDSDDAFWDSMEATGLDDIWNSEGSFGWAADQTKETNGMKCGMQTVLEETGMDIPVLESLPQLPSVPDNFSYQEGDEKWFVTSSHKDNLLNGKFQAAVIAIGETCTIWADKNYAGDLKGSDKIQALINEIDGNITPVLHENFGDSLAMDVDHDGKTAFVIYPFHNEELCSFFNPRDIISALGGEYETYRNQGSQIDVLHINQTMLGTDRMFPAIAHENQHLIHYSQTWGHSDAWLNEVFSENAQALAGYGNETACPEAAQAIDRINADGYASPFVFAGNYVPPTADPYGQWYLFGRYLAAQTEGLAGGGNHLYGTVLKTALEEGSPYATCNARYLMKALTAIGYQGPDKFEELVMNYYMALLLRQPEGIYSITQNKDNSSLIDDMELEPVIPLRNNEKLEQIPGGGAACYVSSPGQAEPSGHGIHMEYAAADFKEVVSNKESRSLQPGEQITLNARGKNTVVYYTTDGIDPADSSTASLYEAPVTINSGMVLRACAYYKTYDKYSPAYTWEYGVSPAKVKAFPEMTDPVQPLLVKEGTFVTLSCETEGASIYYSTEDGIVTLKHMTLYTSPIPVNGDTIIQATSIMDGEAESGQGESCIFRYRTDTKGGDRYEPNNDLDQVASFSFPSVLKETIHRAEDIDVYAFTLDNSAVLSLTLTPPAEKNYGLTLYDGDRNEIGRSELKGNSQNIRVTNAGSGKYYVEVKSLDGSYSDLEGHELTLKKELETERVENLDLSEMSMLRALNQKGSETAYNFGVNGGGNYLMSTAYFTSWEGPVLEETDPYPEMLDGASLEREFKDTPYKSTAEKVQYHVQNVLYTPNDTRENFIAHLKNVLYNYGAAEIYVLWSARHATEDNTNLYVEKRDPEYEDPTNPFGGGGHIITVTGWDDNYSRDHFTGNQAIADSTGVTIPKPKKDGAFICKNSWGTGERTGEEGYFYLSYEDAYMTSNLPTVFMADELPDAYNHQYKNDIKGLVTNLASTTPFAVGEVFECADTPELLRAVSFQTGESNNHYEIFVRTGRKTGKEPIQKVAEGTKKYAGFYTERLEAPILIEAGTSFEVIIRFQGTQGSLPTIGATCDIGQQEGMQVEKIAGKAYVYEDFSEAVDIGIPGTAGGAITPDNRTAGIICPGNSGGRDSFKIRCAESKHAQRQRCGRTCNGTSCQI